VNNRRYTEEDLLHWEHDHNKMCLQVVDRYSIVVASVTDLAYHECGSDRILFETMHNFYRVQRNRVQRNRVKESEC
jgi:hypothetical protein